jgi:DNA-binding XRE family transcriptional regulator
MKKTNKQEQMAAIPIFTGRKFRFFRENAGLTRSELGACIHKSNETIRRIEVWYKDDTVKPAYVNILYKAIDEKLFNSIMNLWEQKEGEDY